MTLRLCLSFALSRCPVTPPPRTQRAAQHIEDKHGKTPNISKKRQERFDSSWVTSKVTHHSEGDDSTHLHLNRGAGGALRTRYFSSPTCALCTQHTHTHKYQSVRQVLSAHSLLRTVSPPQLRRPWRQYRTVRLGGRHRSQHKPLRKVGTGLWFSNQR